MLDIINNHGPSLTPAPNRIKGRPKTSASYHLVKSDRVFETIKKLTARNKYPKHATLSYVVDNKTRESYMSPYEQVLKSYPNLRIPRNLKLVNPTNLNKSIAIGRCAADIRGLLHILKRHKNLQSLELNLKQFITPQEIEADFQQQLKPKAFAKGLKPHQNTLTSLSLSGYPTTEKIISNITKISMKNLKDFHIFSIDTDRNEKQLALLLKNYDALEKFSMDMSYIKNPELTNLIETLRTRANLRYLNWSNIELNNEAAGRLAPLLSKFKVIKLPNCCIDLQWGALPILKHLQSNNVLEYLDISYNNINKEAVWFLGKVLSHNKLRFLDISGSMFKEEESTRLVQALERGNSLEHLDLSQMPLNNKIVKDLVIVLKHHSELKTLYLDLCENITEEGAAHLMELLQPNSKITNLTIDRNPNISPETVSKIKGLLERNRNNKV